MCALAMHISEFQHILVRFARRLGIQSSPNILLGNLAILETVFTNLTCLIF